MIAVDDGSCTLLHQVIISRVWLVLSVLDLDMVSVHVVHALQMPDAVCTGVQARSSDTVHV